MHQRQIGHILFLGAKCSDAQGSVRGKSDYRLLYYTFGGSDASLEHPVQGGLDSKEL